MPQAIISCIFETLLILLLLLLLDGFKLQENKMMDSFLYFLCFVLFMHYCSRCPMQGLRLTPETEKAAGRFSTPVFTLLFLPVLLKCQNKMATDLDMKLVCTHFPLKVIFLYFLSFYFSTSSSILLTSFPFQKIIQFFLVLKIEKIQQVEPLVPWRRLMAKASGQKRVWQTTHFRKPHRFRRATAMQRQRKETY